MIVGKPELFDFEYHYTAAQQRIQDLQQRVILRDVQEALGAIQKLLDDADTFDVDELTFFEEDALAAARRSLQLIARRLS